MDFFYIKTFNFQFNQKESKVYAIINMKNQQECHIVPFEVEFGNFIWNGCFNQVKEINFVKDSFIREFPLTFSIPYNISLTLLQNKIKPNEKWYKLQVQPQHLSSKQTIFLTQLLSEHTIEIVTSSFIKEKAHTYIHTHKNITQHIAYTIIILFLSFILVSNTWEMWLKNKQISLAKICGKYEKFAFRFEKSDFTENFTLPSKWVSMYTMIISSVYINAFISRFAM